MFGSEINASEFAQAISDADFEYLSNVIGLGLLRKNPLRDLLPSRFTFYGSGCWAVEDLVREAKEFHPNYGDEIAAKVSRILPKNVTVARPFISDYWATLTTQRYSYSYLIHGYGRIWQNVPQYLDNLGECCYGLGSSWQNCKLGFREFHQNWYTNVSLSDLNFNSTCGSTPIFWNNYSFNRPSRGWWTTSTALDLFRSFLPSEHSQAPAKEVQYVLMKTMLDKELHGVLTSAANDCQPEYCRIIDFDGNADIAGKGALVAYCLIAGLATIFAIYSVFCSSPFLQMITRNWLHRPRFYEATTSASLSFYDTVLYFNIMACIAGVWYTGQASTVYEIDLCILVALLTCNATTMLSMLSQGLGERRERFTRATVHITGLIISFGSIHNSLSRISHDSYLEDFHCYGKRNLPHRFLLASVRLQLVVWGLYLAQRFIYLLLKIFKHTPRDHNINNWPLYIWKMAQKIFFPINIVLMWIDLAFIVIIRNEAKDIFGASYADNKMGYGQIIACGFCLQTVVQWIMQIILPKSPDANTPSPMLDIPRYRDNIDPPARQTEQVICIN